MSEVSILELMTVHHAELKDMLSSPRILEREYYERFMWELEKHIFIEERAIFIHCTPTSKAEHEALVKVTEEHTEILKMLKNTVITGERPEYTEIETLKAMLQAHQAMEEETLYPYLDSYLDDAAKAMIIGRIKEII